MSSTNNTTAGFNMSTPEGSGPGPQTEDRPTKSQPEDLKDNLSSKKEDKVSGDSKAEDVAGRGGKGLGGLDKLVPGK